MGSAMVMVEARWVTRYASYKRSALVERLEDTHNSLMPQEMSKGATMSKREQIPLLKRKQEEAPKSHFPLLTYEQSLKEVPWQTDNVHIQKGYRRHLGTVGLCLWSSIGCESTPRVRNPLTSRPAQ
jgi:hypothetical protein